jgi:predicted site-specific integrase-resolvase
MSETLALPSLPRLLRGMTGRRVTYQTLYRYVLNGDLPAKKNEAGRWLVDRADVDVIAAKLSEGN